MSRFSLQFGPELIPNLSLEYQYGGDTYIETEIAPLVTRRGYFTKDEFIHICTWKSPRVRSRVSSNPSSLIEEATEICLSTHFEELRIGSLLSLHGVGIPIASALLHFTFSNTYPILDRRALWSIGERRRRTVYPVSYWNEYRDYCQKLRDTLNFTMRTIDRALWQFSKNNEPSDSLKL